MMTGDERDSRHELNARNERDARDERHARHEPQTRLEPQARRERRLDELLRTLDASAKGHETVDSGAFMAGVIAKGNRIRDGLRIYDAHGAMADGRAVMPGFSAAGRTAVPGFSAAGRTAVPEFSAAGFARSLASMQASGELETVVIMLASVPFLVAGLAKPVYLLAGCALSAGAALVRSLILRSAPAKRGLG